MRGKERGGARDVSAGVRTGQDIIVVVVRKDMPLKRSIHSFGETGWLTIPSEPTW
jgi:hypothetical protein